MSENIKIIECPRDAMQGIHEFIPTQQKIKYLNALLKVGFDTLDFGSFVSPKAIPQLSDTAEVLAGLNLSETKTKLLAIVANKRGAEEAIKYPEIEYLGFPFSISETFQLRNTNKTISESFDTVKEMQAICLAANKKLVIYISMGFGNPYNEPWNVEIVEKWADEMNKIGITIISLSDTIGSSKPETIKYLFDSLIPRYSQIEFGAHLHTQPHTWFEKVEAAYDAGCRRFDGALKGLGGCPMAIDDLVGNMPTENLITFCAAKKLKAELNNLSFESAYNVALQTFPSL
jgi:hydroxymethylglutaryl-CoA lyase